jgi:hypothetical protein
MRNCPPCRLSPSASISVSSPLPNASSAIAPIQPRRCQPSSTPTAAPTAAPDETPTMYGSASELRSSP